MSVLLGIKRKREKVKERREENAMAKKGKGKRVFMVLAKCRWWWKSFLGT